MTLRVVPHTIFGTIYSVAFRLLLQWLHRSSGSRTSMLIPIDPPCEEAVGTSRPSSESKVESSAAPSG